MGPCYSFWTSIIRWQKHDFAEAWYWSRDLKMTEIELKVNMKYSDSDEKYREELDVLCQRKLFKI